MRHALAALLGAAALSLAAPALAGGVGDCTESSDTTAAQTSRQQSRPLQMLGIRQAQALVAAPGRLPGAGINVAVVDSGIRPADQIHVVASYSVHSATVHTASYHGTAVAGLVSGRTRPGHRLTGIAPGAGIVDVQVYGWADGASGQPTDPLTEDVARGLSWLAGRAVSLHVKVAVVPLAVTPTHQLAAAVRALQAKGVLVVAPSGTRPTDATPGYLSQYFKARPGQDGVADIGPALYPGVLTAATTAAGPSLAYDPASIPNSAVDVVVPTARGISIALSGGNCVLSVAATSWSAGEVGGIAALLFERYAGESPAQIAARIVDTASGTTADGHGTAARSATSLYFGAGVVQPVDALTRPLAPAKGGLFNRLVAMPDRTPPAVAPLPQSDVLHHSQHVAVWAALVGGALVVVASILRPLFVRRSPAQGARVTEVVAAECSPVATKRIT